MKFQDVKRFIPGAALIAALSVPAQMQVGYPGCTKPTAEDFTAEAIVTRAKDNAHSPIKMDFHVVKDATAPNGYWTNFYFNELHTGKIRYYSEKTKAVTEVGSVVGGKFGGMDTFSGLVLDPNFETNRWIYANYSSDGKYRLARFTITADNALDPASMKVLVEVPKSNGKWHGENAIDFDAHGDLYAGFGDNGTENNASGNYGLSTKDMRASIIRIHPDNSAKGYSIPKDNMGEYWSKKFTEQGKADLAAQYADPSKVTPEIYVTGVRNPYTIKVVHAKNRWVSFGDVGPDFGKNTEEFNILQQPGFAGWPVFAGVEPHLKPAGASINIEGISTISETTARGGATSLPPVIRSQYDMHQASGVGGPIYWYDGTLKSDRKFPAYYHGKWFVGDNDQAAWKGPPWVRALTMNPDYTKVASEEDFFAFTKERIQEIYFGPDGAMYIAYFYQPWFGDNAANEIWRFSYKGTNKACLPADLVPPDGAVMPAAGLPTSASRNSSPMPKIHFSAWGEFQLPDWRGEVRLFDVAGNEIPLQRFGNGNFRMQSKPTAGVYFLKAGAQVIKVGNIRGD